MEGIIKKNVVIIGDGYVGKTSILNSIKQQKFEEQIPNLWVHHGDVFIFDRDEFSGTTILNTLRRSVTNNSKSNS